MDKLNTAINELMIDKSAKRFLTKKQEQVLRLCHHDFEGLTQTEAAERLGINHQAIHNILKRIKKIAPQLFPILTKLEAKIYHYFTVDGWSVKEIAEYLDEVERKISDTLLRVKKKGKPFPSKVKLLRYNSGCNDEDDTGLNFTDNMDNHVKQKF